MVAHVVLLKPKEDVKEQDLLEALDNIKLLQHHIPGILNVRTGINLSQRNAGYSHGFIIDFEDLESLKNYDPHPAHLIVSTKLVHLCQHIIDFDLP